MLPARATCLRACHVSQVSRCRELYGKYLQWDGANCAAWIAFAELEASLGELERSRAIFDLAISQQSLDQPEALWKVRRDAAEITSVEIGGGTWGAGRGSSHSNVSICRRTSTWRSGWRSGSARVACTGRCSSAPSTSRYR